MGIFTRCKFSLMSREGSCLVKISAGKCSFDCGFYCKHLTNYFSFSDVLKQRSLKHAIYTSHLQLWLRGMWQGPIALWLCGLRFFIASSYNVITVIQAPLGPVTRKPDPPILVPPGPNISKYLDPPDNLFQFCWNIWTPRNKNFWNIWTSLKYFIPPSFYQHIAWQPEG